MSAKKYFVCFVLITILSSCYSNSSGAQLIGAHELNDSIDSTEALKTDRDTTVSQNIWDNIRKKADWFKNNAVSKTDLNRIPIDFIQFYKEFVSDSTYQSSHISFSKLIGVIGECDTTIVLNPDNWKFTEWNFLDFFSSDNTGTEEEWKNLYFSSPNKFYYEFYLHEVGMIYRTGFEFLDGRWQLTLYYVNAC